MHPARTPRYLLFRLCTWTPFVAHSPQHRSCSLNVCCLELTISNTEMERLSCKTALGHGATEDRVQAVRMGPECPWIAVSARWAHTALPAKALDRWPDPGSSSIKHCFWGTHSVASGTTQWCPVPHTRFLSCFQGGGAWGPVAMPGWQMGLQGTGQGCATSQSQGARPPMCSPKEGARQALKGSWRPTASPDWESLKEHLEHGLPAN